MDKKTEGFLAWLATASPASLDEAAEKYEGEMLNGWEGLKAAHTKMGGILWRYRAVIKKRGSRDWLAWVTNVMPPATAYDWIHLYEKAEGLADETVADPDVVNPRDAELKQAVAAAKAARAGLIKKPKGQRIELEGHVKVPYTDLYSTRTLVDDFKQERERNEDRWVKLYQGIYYEFIGENDPTVPPEVSWGSLDDDDGFGWEEENGSV